MVIKKDIETREDILLMVEEFYRKVRADETIGMIFNEIVDMDWEHHVPLITDFWETIILDNPVYLRNAMGKHFDVNRLIPLEKKHFDAWLNLFSQTVFEMYSGEKANLAVKRAQSIAAVMNLKMDEENRRKG